MVIQLSAFMRVPEIAYKPIKHHIDLPHTFPWVTLPMVLLARTTQIDLCTPESRWWNFDLDLEDHQEAFFLSFSKTVNRPPLAATC